MQVRAEQLPQHLARGLQPVYTIHGDEPLLDRTIVLFGSGMGDASGAGLPARERAELSGPQRLDQGRAAEQPGDSSWSDIEWLACADGKARPTKSGIFPLAHGLSARLVEAATRCAGNSVVPQVLIPVLESIRAAFPA